MNYIGNILQWGSEIRTSLDFEWSKIGWVANGLDFEQDLKSGSPTIWNPDSLSKSIWSLDKNVQISKGPVFLMVGTIAIAIAKAQPYEIQPIWNPTFKKSGFKWSISDPHCKRHSLELFEAKAREKYCIHHF